MATDFSRPNENYTTDSTNTYIGNYTSKIHPSHNIGRSLQNGTGECPKRSKKKTKNSFDTATSIR